MLNGSVRTHPELSEWHTEFSRHRGNGEWMSEGHELVRYIIRLNSIEIKRLDTAGMFSFQSLRLSTLKLFSAKTVGTKFKHPIK